MEPYAGEQFTPSDPLPVIGILNPSLNKLEHMRVEVKLPLKSEEKVEEAYPVIVESDTNSRIAVVTWFNVEVFLKEMEKSLHMIEQYEQSRMVAKVMGQLEGAEHDEEKESIPAKKGESNPKSKF